MDANNFPNKREELRLGGLPTEILLRIINFLPSDTQKSLRCTNKSFSTLTATILFRKFTLLIALHVPPEYASLGPAAGGGPPYRYTISTLIQPPTIKRSQSLADMLINLHEGGQVDSLLKTLHENVQEIVIKRYDLYGREYDAQKVETERYAFSMWGIAVLRQFLAGMKKLRVIDWDMPLSNLSEAVNSPSLAATVTSLTTTCDNAEWYSRVYKKIGSRPPSNTGLLALQSLTRLEILISHNCEFKGLNRLPNLAHLDFEATQPSQSIVAFLEAQTVQFKLRTLIIRNEIKELEFPDQVVHDFLRSLEKLHLETPDAEIKRQKDAKSSSRNNGVPPYLQSYVTVDGPMKPIWTILRENGIYLRDISMYGQSPALVDYLLSYPSSAQLEVLEVKVWPYMTTDTSIVFNFVNDLWAKVVRMHQSSLKKVAIYPDTSSAARGGNIGGMVLSCEELEDGPPKRVLFEVTDEIRSIIKGCRKLETLEVGNLRGGYEDCKAFLGDVMGYMASGIKLKKVGYHQRGWSKVPVLGTLLGTGAMYFVREWSEVRKPLIDKRWDLPEDRGLAQDLEHLDVHFVPMKEMWFAKDEDSSRQLKLIDDEYLRKKQWEEDERNGTNLKRIFALYGREVPSHFA
ncbi:hypothetical protein TWF694_005560 [Orbilia ellipsospora]|uniref:F-box domain-containing protein n=1 Tax=Orbilia ellipsospora TaxID=2528407 RepID=A0AAV9WUS5_9PEZI